MIKERAAFHISDTFPECHLGLHGLLDLNSDAFHAPVMRRILYQRCVPDLPPLSRW